MDFDFKQSFRELGTPELLNIIRQAADYQPEAVLAAIAIVRERTVSQEDYQQAEQMFKKPIPAVPFNRQVKQLSQKVENVLDPVIHPSTVVEPGKWINILLIGLAILFVWITTQFTFRIVRLYQRHNLSYFSFTELVPVLYLPLIMLGVYKRKKWGWTLLMIYFTLGLLFAISGFYYLYKYYDVLKSNLAGFCWPVILNGTAVFFVWRNDITDYFAVNSKSQRNTILISFVLFLLLLCFL